MIGGLIGRKVAMTQLFQDGSILVPVTVLEVGPCRVIQKKTVEKDGYSSVQIGYGKRSSGNKATVGHCASAGLAPMRRIVEVSCDDNEVKPGDVFTAELFKEGDKVDVIGTGKGKGFTGVIKRHGFAGQPASHGGKAHRRPGSVGQASYPARVWKGIKMAGRSGGKGVTAQGLKVVSVNIEKNLVTVSGSVPGRRGSEIFIRPSVKREKGGSQVADG